MKRNTYLVALALIIVQAISIYSVAFAATVFEKTDCANGFKGAYTITGIEPTGQITMIRGIDCNGAPIKWDCRAVSRDGNLLETYTHYFTETINGQTWFAKVQLNLHGQVTKAWGQVASGEYYEYVPTVTP